MYELVFVLLGHETWSLTLRECHRLGNFENRALRKLFVAKREEFRADYRKSHNDELPAFCSPPHTDRVVKSRKKETGGTSGTYGGKQKYIQGFGG